MIYHGHSTSPNFEMFWARMHKKYPQKLFEIDGVGNKQLDSGLFADKFFAAGITSDVSVDANANIDDHNVVSYSMEHKKPLEKFRSYFELFNELEKMVDTKYANDVCEMQLNGDLYVNDFHGFSLKMPYCFNYSTFDIMQKGLSVLHRPKCDPPKHLFAFKSQIEQFITIAANSTLGATGLADLLIVFSLYLDQILETKSDAHFSFVDEESCWRYAKESLISLVYTLNQPMRGNQCVKEDTEVLTPAGFKKYYELNVGDPIYAWDNGKLVVSKVDKVNVYEYSGIMHEYSGRDCIQTVTPTHRILRQKNNRKLEFELVESEKIFDCSTPLSFPVAMPDISTPDFPISDDELILLTLILTDGSIDMEKNGRISIFKSPSRFGHSLITSTLENLDLAYSTSELNSAWGGIVKAYRISTESSQKYVKILNGNKKSLPALFFQLSKRQANLVVDTWASFDDYVEEDSYNKTKLQCDNYLIADQLQHVCFLAGKGSRQTERVIGSNKKATIYVIPYSRLVKSACKKRRIKYSGKVWCPTTKQGVVVFREDGKIFVSGNSPFSNCSVYDSFFLKDMLPDYISPLTGKFPRLETVQKMQDIYLESMNEEMSRSPLTFPVTTSCFSVPKTGKRRVLDRDFLHNISKFNRQFGFINIFSGDSSTLSSCCRLQSNKDFLSLYSNSFGSGSSKIGSLGVVTINLPRLALKYGKNEPLFLHHVIEMVDICSTINQAKANIIKKAIDDGYCPLYAEDFIVLSRQYRTVGINGFYEAIKYCGKDPLTDGGVSFGIKLLDKMNKRNNELSDKLKVAHNMEQVPGETLSVKLAAKDHLLNWQQDCNIYSNQFIPLTTPVDLLDRIKIQGTYDKHFTGGAIGHFNLEEVPRSVNEIADFIETCVEAGAVYFALNYNLQQCKNNHIIAGKRKSCAKCGAEIVNEYSRPVGFLANTKNFNQVRRETEYPERQFYGGDDFSEHFGNSILT